MKIFSTPLLKSFLLKDVRNFFFQHVNLFSTSFSSPLIEMFLRSLMEEDQPLHPTSQQPHQLQIKSRTGDKRKPGRKFPSGEEESSGSASATTSANSSHHVSGAEGVGDASAQGLTNVIPVITSPTPGARGSHRGSQKPRIGTVEEADHEPELETTPESTPIKDPYLLQAKQSQQGGGGSSKRRWGLFKKKEDE